MLSHGDTDSHVSQKSPVVQLLDKIRDGRDKLSAVFTSTPVRSSNRLKGQKPEFSALTNLRQRKVTRSISTPVILTSDLELRERDLPAIPASGVKTEENIVTSSPTFETQSSDLNFGDLSIVENSSNHLYVNQIVPANPSLLYQN